jgi:hypothetical protein
MIDRRNFLQGAALLGAAPLAVLFQLSSETLPLKAGEPTNMNRVAFKIHGWDCCDEPLTGNQVWIRIHRSWRTAWR